MKWLKVVVGVVAILLLAAFFIINFFRYAPRNRPAFSKPPTSVSPKTELFITANPLDLTQIQRISKFRSCIGHNYSGHNTAGEKEDLRSMKHYIEPKEGILVSSVNVFAPFNGTISDTISDIRTDTTRGSGVFISTKESSGWQFIFFHVDLLPEFNQKGSAVKAGQKIGTVNQQSTGNFDMALKYFGMADQIFDSPFLHMSETVLAQYASRGVTPENIIFSKAERDSLPCQTQDGETGTDARFVGFKTSDWVTLK